jgi:hypothetical protein
MNKRIILRCKEVIDLLKGEYNKEKPRIDYINANLRFLEEVLNCELNYNCNLQRVRARSREINKFNTEKGCKGVKEK